MLDRTDRSLVGVWWWTVDKWLLASAMMLIVIGTLLVMAAGPAVANLIQLSSQHFIIRQLIYLIPTLGLMIAVSMLEPRTIRAFALFGLALVIGLMVMAIVMGSEVKGATRWVSIAGFSLQPSELAKPLFAIVSAWLLTLWREGQDFPGWAYATALLGIIVAILVAQPDIGMTSLVLLTFSFQLFLAGLPLLLVFAAIALAPLVGWLAYSQFGHVQQRIDKFLDGGGMQTERSIQSFAQGGWFGVGPGDGTVKQYLPDASKVGIYDELYQNYQTLGDYVSGGKA